MGQALADGSWDVVALATVQRDTRPVGKVSWLEVPSSPRYTGQWTAASSSTQWRDFPRDQKVDLSVTTALMRLEALQHDCPAPSVERFWKHSSRTFSQKPSASGSLGLQQFHVGGSICRTVSPESGAQQPVWLDQIDFV